MNTTAKEFQPAYQALSRCIAQEDFLTDKSGCKLVELISPRIELTINDDEDGFVDFESKQSPRKYIAKELAWYDSYDLSIDKVKDVAIWQQVANKFGRINSNYGNLAFSSENCCQFGSVLNTLVRHKDSRQGIIIYTRPSIQLEWNADDGTDFICTNFQHFMIRNNKLICVTNMRSQDVIFGTFSDTPWFFTVYKRMLTALRETYPDLEYGKMIMTYNSFHCYERHFDLLKSIAAE